MAAVDPRIRNIKIKTGVVKRLAKEKVAYQKEGEEQKVRISKMEAEGKDEYDIRKQNEVLQESLNMVPDCQRRLNVAYEDLKALLDNEDDLKETEEYGAAAAVLKDVQASMS